MKNLYVKIKSFLVEYPAMLIALIILIGLLSYYGWIFRSWEVTANNNAFGTFGDFIGGVLNPLFSLIVIYLLLVDLKFTRNELKLTNEIHRSKLIFDENSAKKESVLIALDKIEADLLAHIQSSRLRIGGSTYHLSSALQFYFKPNRLDFFPSKRSSDEQMDKQEEENQMMVKKVVIFLLHIDTFLNNVDDAILDLYRNRYKYIVETVYNSGYLIGDNVLFNLYETN